MVVVVFGPSLNLVTINSCNCNRQTIFRAFIDLWFAKPMVCMRVAFHENDGNRDNNKDNKGNSLIDR